MADADAPSRLRRWPRLTGWLVVIASLLALSWLFAPFASAYIRYFLLPNNDDQLTAEVDVANSPQSGQSGAVATDQSAAVSLPALVIDKLAINAPLVMNVNTTKMAEYNAALDHGIAHMKGTPDVTAPTGNTVLFGHSSRVPPTGTEFDAIFATLPQLAKGDAVRLVAADGTKLDFTVTESKVIGPNDTSVIASTTDRRVTIITCWPLGTNLKRWVVIASGESS